MGSLRRWRVVYSDRDSRVLKADTIVANGEPDKILDRLRDRYPSRRFRSIEPEADFCPPWFGSPPSWRDPPAASPRSGKKGPHPKG